LVDGVSRVSVFGVSVVVAVFVGGGGGGGGRGCSTS
jgi:hypothetical protein